jgi:hypothetical protein
VVGNTTRHERVCELEEDGGCPGDEEDDLLLKLPADGVAGKGYYLGAPPVRRRSDFSLKWSRH